MDLKKVAIVNDALSDSTKLLGACRRDISSDLL